MQPNSEREKEAHKKASGMHHSDFRQEEREERRGGKEKEKEKECMYVRWTMCA